MLWFWLPFAIAALVALFGLVRILLWIHEIVLELRMLREHRLWKDRTGLLFGLAVSGTGFTCIILYVYPFFLPFLGDKLIQDTRFLVMAWYAFGAFLCTLPLWVVSLFLRVRARRHVAYCYFLPHDANRVRIKECLSGMHLAVISLPGVIKEDLLDPLIRAILVSSRAEVFPEGNRGKLLFTNNFAVYCDLAVKASIQGYYSMLQLYMDNRALYDELAPLVNTYPDVDDAAKKRLQALAQQITSGVTGQNGEQA